MRIKPLPPDTLSPEVRYVHDEIASLIGRSQSQVNMLDAQGALLGPFPPMLHYPQFGIPALTFLRSLDMHATLDKRVREGFAQLAPLGEVARRARGDWHRRR